MDGTLGSKAVALVLVHRADLELVAEGTVDGAAYGLTLSGSGKGVKLAGKAPAVALRWTGAGLTGVLDAAAVELQVEADGDDGRVRHAWAPSGGSGSAFPWR